MIINVAQTRYDIIKKVAKRVCNWRLRYFIEDEDGAVSKGERGLSLSPAFDLTWHDLGISADFFAKLLPY